MNEEKVIIEYQYKLQEKEVKKFKDGTTNYYVLCYIDKLEQENQQLKEQLQNKQDIINGILDYIDSNKFVEEFKNVVNERNVRNEILNRDKGDE